MQITIEHRNRSVSLTVRDADLLPLTPVTPDDLAKSPADLLRDSLAEPLRYAPLRLALTPDDHVTVVLDEGLPHLVTLLVGVLAEIVAAGVSPEAITILVPPGAGRQGWLDDLPDEYQDVRVEVHDPANVQRTAYVMSTRAGRRVYLNRSVVEADLTVVLSGTQFDPLLGHGGGATALFPALSNAETLAELAGRPSLDGPGPHGKQVWGEANEAAAEVNLFFVHAIEGMGDSIAEIVCGQVDTATDVNRLQDLRWRKRTPQRADTVIATLSGDPNRHDFAALARAFAHAARITNSEGRIVLVTAANPPLPPAGDVLRQCDEPEDALERLLAEWPEGYVAGCLWAMSAMRASLFLVSGLDGEVVEELFAAPLDRPEYAQRLVDAPGACLYLPDAHKMWVNVGERRAKEE